MNKFIKTKNANRPSIFLIISFAILVLLIFESTAYAETVYKLILKNGKTVKTPAYRYTGDMIQYEMYGAFISIKKSSVKKIEKGMADASPSKNHIATHTSVHLKIPVYYEVKGAPRRNNIMKIDGIYESDESEDFGGFPLYRNISGIPYLGLFYQCKKRGGKNCFWVLGYHDKNSGFYIYERANKEPEPVFYSLWKGTSSLNRSYPDMSVRKISPPETVYRGRVSYKSINFPNNDCNGTFSPVSVKNGWVKYKMVNSETVLEYSHSKKWVVRYRGRVAYKAKNYPSASLPDAVQGWDDVNKRPVNGKIELIKYQ